MSCKLAVFKDNQVVKYTCHEVRNFIEKWKRDFYIINACRSEKDKAYMRYCESLDEFVSQCKCHEDKKCDKCKPEDHDGFFCRCESRNIALAKVMRQESNESKMLSM